VSDRKIKRVEKKDPIQIKQESEEEEEYESEVDEEPPIEVKLPAKKTVEKVV